MFTGIVAFAFGAPSSSYPNRVLAQTAKTAFQETGALGIYTQADIKLPLQRLHCVTYTEEVPGKPPSTLRIARGAARWAKQLCMKRLVIVCATPHWWRCQRDLHMALKEVGYNCLVERCPIPKRYDTDKTWFQIGSIQSRTRSRSAFMTRELILRYIPYSIYKKIAA